MKTQLILFLILYAANSVFQGAQGQAPTTQPLKKIPSVKILVLDHETGSPVKSATINFAGKNYTSNESGVIELSDINEMSVFFIEADGFVRESRAIKAAEMTIRLIRSAQFKISGMVDFGTFKRHSDHLSSEAIVITGDEVRRYNSLDIFGVIAVYDPGFIAFRNNQSGSDPNVPTQIQIRGTRNFPTDAAVAVAKVPNSNGVQVNPSSGDFIASQISNPYLPLLLLDGMEISIQQLADINIHRIKSITLLKDASAANSYGSRGVNGVVLVQTYSYRPGVYNLTYTGQFQVVSADLASYNLLPNEQKIDLESKAGMYNAGNQSIYNNHVAFMDTGNITNWQKRPLQTGIGSTHSLRFDGGNETVSYGVNLFHNSLPGTMKSTSRITNNFDANFGFTYRTFSFKTILSYTRATGQYSTLGSFAEYNQQNPYWNTYDAYGRIQKILELPTAAGDTAFNPEYNSTLSTKNSSQYYRIGNSSQLQLKLRNGFAINGRLSMYKVDDQVDLFYPPGHTMFAQYTPDVYFKRGIYTLTNGSFKSLDGNLNVDYRKQFGLHYFYATAGLSIMSTSSESTVAQVQGFTSDQLADIAFGANYTTPAPTTGKIETRLLSAYSNFTYSYNNRYQAEIGLTRDGSSSFGNNTRYATYPSVAASWNVHNESFLSSAGWVNKLKFKAAYGVTGSRFFPSYLSNTSYNYFTDQQYVLGIASSSSMGIGVGSYLINVGNSNLESPKISTQNFGVDMVLFNNRLFIRANVYKEESRMLVLPEHSNSYTGFTSFSSYDNTGAIDNKGFEFAISGVLLQNKKKDFRWSLGVNGLKNENSIVAVSSYVLHVNSENNSASKDQTRPQTKYVPGNPINALWAVPSLGLDPTTGKEVFRKLNGDTTTTWSADDKIMAGSTDPLWRGTFNSMVNYKQFTLGLYVAYRLGGYVYNQTLADRVENANVNYQVDARAFYTNRWSANNLNAPYKALAIDGLSTNPTYATTRFVEKENIFSLSGVSLAYTFRESSNVKFPLQQTSITGYANNLWMTGGAEMERGIQYPYARSFVLKFTTSFR